MSKKPALPKGMRDFGPVQMARRNFITDTIRSVFQKFGFMPLETPAMENLDTLTGKYGDEGDQLLFKVLNSGDFLAKTTPEDYRQGSRHLLPLVAGKGLKYDLTVPFARYVAMNRHHITFPFKRYQIQPVWRADRPQKGRYREFCQCDADVTGTDSLLCEAEVIVMIREVFALLGIEKYAIKINHRQVLSGVATAIGAEDNAADLFTAIDKLDKIGVEKVCEELHAKGFTNAMTEKLRPILSVKGTVGQVMEYLGNLFGDQQGGRRGLADIAAILDYLGSMGYDAAHLSLDTTLARGLAYYTGAIFEVAVEGVAVGSVSGGGRYDDLTGIFGLTGTPGVGFSFGIDRLYDCMEELGLFSQEPPLFSDVLIVHFDESSMKYGLSVLQKLRSAGIRSEIYPEQAKLKKQFGYADKKGIPYTIAIGSDEMKTGLLTLKEMKTGKQSPMNTDQLIDYLTRHR